MLTAALRSQPAVSSVSSGGGGGHGHGGSGPSLNIADIKASIEKRLFIGRVPADTTEDDIRSIFGIYGNLTELRLVADRSICFVGFDSWGSAHRALLETDGKAEMRGNNLVVSFAERTTSVGRGGGAAYAKGMTINRVFIGNLPEDATEDALMSLFSPYGRIEGCNLLPAKTHRRCAYVNYSIWGEAMDAVERLNGQPLHAGGDGMAVSLAMPRDGQVQSGGSTTDRYSDSAKRRRIDDSGTSAAGATPEITRVLNAYITAVNSEASRSACDALHEQLMSCREQARRSAGAVAVPMDMGGGGYSHNGYGGGGGHQTAMMGSHAYGGMAHQHTAQPALITTSSADRDSARLFIGGLPHECTDDDLANLAGQLSFTQPPDLCRIIECRVLPNRGCGYLRYCTWEAADEAYAALQGRQVEGWPQVLRVQWATPKPQEVTGGGGSAGVVIPEPVGQPDPLCFATKEAIESQGLEATRLFVGQIARDAEAGNRLRGCFNNYGHVTEFKFMQDKGILYVSYSKCAEAQAALLNLNNQSLPGISKCLNVKFSTLRRA
eukprot:gnl/TRDRNA2_/TRDRNA2_197797_c0_seq1.p1 gnl/TRDRNA2_/TRDRNA2_197797_c0~~gnl/TRDRNA2_/TRDRNA2_197797_c0_seq1.p1  ORF type:complete len:565 (-),score=77.42 gnl/TRDRNA2_/TRDRNA2_197797_c0_seq1:55-1704(-)